MKHDCSRCGGEGKESYEEDGRIFTDTCYHCAGEGKVDDDLHFHDQLSRVAVSIAEVMESDYRRACDSDPEGDGYNLCAYENQMMPFDYFKCRVWERAAEIGEKLATMSRSDQEFLIAWDEFIPGPGILERPVPTLIDELLKASPEVQQACVDMAAAGTEDDIPF